MIRLRVLHAVLGLVAAGMFTGLPAESFAEDSMPTEYQSLYCGYGSEADAARAAYRLWYHGFDGTWTGVTQTTYMSGESDVNHWDVTNGNPGIDPWPGGNQRDFIYLSGHGSRGIIPIWGAPADLIKELDDRGRWDNVGPRLGANQNFWNEPVRWEIGSDVIGANRTSSRWDDDVEWIVLSACAQLSAEDGSRRDYARALLGDPHRAHMVLGYDSTAPGDPQGDLPGAVPEMTT